MRIDLSGSGCGCNAALYLASVPQNDDKTSCDDFFCDANAICGAACDESERRCAQPALPATASDTAAPHV